MANVAFTVTVLSATQIVANIIGEIENFPLGNNLLQNVLKSITAANVGAACGQLGAFINQVEAQRGKKLTQVEANTLVRMAGDAKAALGCS
jgi:hypothetical protein